MRILVVDDYADSAEALAELLEIWGHEVRVALDGAAALAAAQVFRPALAILDLELPDMDGGTLQRRLQQLPELERTVFVALTGHDVEGAGGALANASFARFVRKPPTVRDLEEALRLVPAP